MLIIVTILNEMDTNFLKFVTIQPKIFELVLRTCCKIFRKFFKPVEIHQFVHRFFYTKFFEIVKEVQITYFGVINDSKNFFGLILGSNNAEIRTFEFFF